MIHQRFCSLLIPAFVMGAATASHAQTIPDTATPGAIVSPLPDLLIQPDNTLDITIPAKQDRPLNLESGPVIQVEKITLYELGKGYEKGLKIVSDAHVEKLIEGSLTERSGGFTLGQLQALADEITNYYRQRGWILSTVYLPEQEVDGGAVVFHLLPGTLSGTSVQGESSYSDEQLMKPFDDSLDSILDKDEIERGLLTVLSYPGIAVSGVLEPGEEVGTTRLNLAVNSEDRFTGLVYLDNKGSSYSGEERLGVGLLFNNPLGLTDLLRLDGMVQNKPEVEGENSVNRAFFGGLTYSLRPFDPDYEFSVTLAENQYDIGRELATFGFEGKTRRTSLGVKKQLQRSRTFNDSVSFALDLNDAQVTRDGDLESQDKLTTVELKYNADFTDGVMGGGYSALAVSYTRGLEDTLGSFSNGDERISRLSADGRAPVDFSKFNLSVSRYQRFIANTSLRGRFNLQYSDDPLVSLEQFSIGGADSVRAYPGAEFMADKGFFASVEWIVPAPFFSDTPAFKGRTWGDVLQLSAFYDYGRGVKNDALANEDKDQKLDGYGLGLRFAPLESVELNFTVARALAGEPSNKREPQIFVDLIYQF
ncbi:ShlB/FhaC/HecB family hemolysin secretion/activation protein [Aliamphritea ceti]|uniref:ShlB/FhaC/HecB family hemolysin secretion/activation protein n=1 Tax=Aliamphritea ceti TaxID=1524258 RepID=UPI0021C338DE|nr:ShlB/FhaC/HecB family hemolysin secretion/activation protein [Aliamphritea ceti]